MIILLREMLFISIVLMRPVSYCLSSRNPMLLVPHKVRINLRALTTFKGCLWNVGHHHLMIFSPSVILDCLSFSQGWNTAGLLGQSSPKRAAGEEVSAVLWFDLSCVRWLAASVFPQGATSQGECVHRDKHVSRNTNPATVKKIKNKHAQITVWLWISGFVFYSGCSADQFTFLPA